MLPSKNSSNERKESINKRTELIEERYGKIKKRIKNRFFKILAYLKPGYFPHFTA